MQKRNKRLEKQELARLKRIGRQEQSRKVLGGEDVENDDRPQSLWEKIGEERLYAQLREMGDRDAAIDKFQRRRVFKATLFALFTLILGIFVHFWFYVAVPIVAFASYKIQIRKVDNYYRAWKFERQLNFSKFTRLVIPYLKASGGNMALYTIFNRILQRLENETDRNSLYQLMGEMSDNPSDIKPFLDYAERSSGTDMSHLFMSTIFDFQQTTFNTSVIDELGKIASDDMMKSIDEIIAMKLRRFNMFPTKMVMTSFILVVGLGAGILFYNLKDINIGGDGLSVIGEATEEQADDEASDDVDKNDEQDTGSEADSKDEAEDAEGMTDRVKDMFDRSDVDEDELEEAWMENNFDDLDNDSKNNDEP